MPELFVALDLRKGKVVRLLKGDYSQQIVYSDDPIGTARAFAEEGARFLHLVDLEGARSGKFGEEGILKKITRLPLRVQVGGGIRDPETVERILELGAERVVMGTKAVEDFASFVKILERFPGRIVVSVDLREKTIATHGWERKTNLSFSEFYARLEGLPIASLLVTAIERDGTMQGPDFPLYRAILKQTPFPLIASGGVGSLSDLAEFYKLSLEPEGKRLEGVIVGRALYEGRFTVRSALSTLHPEGEKVPHGAHA